MPDELIRIERLSYQYADAAQPALKNINLSITRGEYVAILGPCGAGKTTLCLSLNGIVPHMLMGDMDGRVLIAGADTAEQQVREIARTVGMVFDNPEFQLSQISVEEEIALGLESRGVERQEMLRRIPEVLEIVNLPGYEARAPVALSGGQQQRVAIAAALAVYPEILVLDEPTSNLDPIGKQEVFGVCARLNRARGMTIIIAEHEVEEMALYADRVIVLDQGQIALQGTPHEVFGQVEALHALGLRVPQVTDLAHTLRTRRGVHWDAYPVTLDEAAATLEACLEEVAHG